MNELEITQPATEPTAMDVWRKAASVGFKAADFQRFVRASLQVAGCSWDEFDRCAVEEKRLMMLRLTIIENGATQPSAGEAEFWQACKAHKVTHQVALQIKDAWTLDRHTAWWGALDEVLQRFSNLTTEKREGQYD